MRESQKEGEKLAMLGRYKSSLVRIQFPSRLTVQGVFKPHNTIGRHFFFLVQSRVLLLEHSTPPPLSLFFLFFWKMKEPCAFFSCFDAYFTWGCNSVMLIRYTDKRPNATYILKDKRIKGQTSLGTNVLTGHLLSKTS